MRLNVFIKRQTQTCIPFVISLKLYYKYKSVAHMSSLADSSGTLSKKKKKKVKLKNRRRRKRAWTVSGWFLVSDRTELATPAAETKLIWSLGSRTARVSLPHRVASLCFAPRRDFLCIFSPHLDTKLHALGPSG